jgi:hypothetical protein
MNAPQHAGDGVALTSQERTMLVGLTVAVIVVPAAVGFALHWSIWASALLVLVLLLVPFQVRRTILYRAEQRELRQQVIAQQQKPPPPPPRPELESASMTQPQTPQPQTQPSPSMAPQPGQFQREILPPVALDSAVPDYDFVFSATVYWRTVPRVGLPRPHANPAALAVQSILARAREVTVQELPHRYAMAQVRLTSVLGTILGDGAGSVEAWAGQIQLFLGEDDLARLRRLADVRKDHDIWEHELHSERDRRAYLADDVLKNTGSAVVWWLAHKKGDIDLRDAVDLIGALRQLSAAANNTEVPELDLAASPNRRPVDTTIADRVRDLMDHLGLDTSGRALFLRKLVNAIAASGKPDAADEIRHALDPTAEDPPQLERAPEPISSLLAELTLDLPRVADLPPEPEWHGTLRDALPDYSDEPDPADRPSPSDMDDVDKQ